MNAWIITAPVASVSIRRFTGDEAAARKVRQQLMEELGLKKSQISIDPLYVEPSKGEMLAFLNSMEQRHDGKTITTYFPKTEK